MVLIVMAGGDIKSSKYWEKFAGIKRLADLVLLPPVLF